MLSGTETVYYFKAADLSGSNLIGDLSLPSIYYIIINVETYRNLTFAPRKGLYPEFDRIQVVHSPPWVKHSSQASLRRLPGYRLGVCAEETQANHD